MRQKLRSWPAPGTHPSLLKAAELSARFAVQDSRARGETDDEIRRQVFARFRQGLSCDELDEYARESLMATFRRVVDRELSQESDR